MTRLATRPDDSDSAIDLAITSLNLAARCTWRVLQDYGSDHLPCTVYIRRGQTVRKSRVRRAFHYILGEAGVINELRKKVRVKTEHRKVFTQPPWWSDELQRLWQEKKKARKRAQRDRANEELKRTAQEITQRFKQAAQQAKWDKWECFCHEVTADKALHKFWNLYKMMNNRRVYKDISDFETEDGTWARSDEEKGMALFNRFLQQTDQNNEEERRTILEDIKENYQCESDEVEIGKQDIEEMLKISSNTAPGPDGVRYSHMKMLEEPLLEELAATLNKSLRDGIIPEDWLDSQLVAIPKPNKDPSKIASYRIITMQNTTGKLLEKIVSRRVTSFLEDKQLLPSTMGSYRPRKDTWQNAATLASDVYDGFERGEETLVAALDLEDAYNRVPFEIIMETLVDMQVDHTLVTWIGAALLKRKVSLRVGSWMSETKTITPGLPQGSALSPVLFNVYTVGITKYQLQGPGRTLSFADDILVYRQGRNREDVAASVQEELTRIEEWCNDNNGRLHPGKASVLWCSLNNRAVRADMPTVYIDGSALKRESSLRYLGITFDRTLSSKDHVSNTVNRARKGLIALRTMAGAQMPQRLLLLLYQSLVLSVVDYGLGILTLSKTQAQRLDVLQNEAMRVILGCTRDTSVEAMRYVLNLPSMRERHHLAQVKAYLKVTSDSRHPLHDRTAVPVKSRLKRGTSWVNQAYNTLLQCCEVENIRRGCDWENVSEGMNSYTSTVITKMGRERREIAAVVNNAEINAIIAENTRHGDPVIFTDGSVRRGVQSGWAFTIKVEGRTTKEDSGAVAITTSSMTMEIQAITEALKWISSQEYQHALVATDSMSTLAKIKNRQLYADWIPLIARSHLRRITWLFCPGHAGINGNERADELAGKAKIEGSITLDPAEVLRQVKDMFAAHEAKNVTSHTLATLMGKGIARGAGRHCDLAGTARRVTNQLMMETISRWTLLWTLERRGQQIWTCSECDDACSATK